VGITLLKQEPSAHRPWQNTMLGLDIVDILASPFAVVNCANVNPSSIDD
jgi:hypothetical protein